MTTQICDLPDLDELAQGRPDCCWRRGPCTREALWRGTFLPCWIRGAMICGCSEPMIMDYCLDHADLIRQRAASLAGLRCPRCNGSVALVSMERI